MFQGRQRTYPLLGVFSVSYGPYLSAAECCDESCTCVKFPTRLFLENRPRLIFLYVLLCSTLNIGAEDGSINIVEGKKELWEGKIN